MAGLTYDIDLEPENGEPFSVRVDQRDIAAWELEPFGAPVVEHRAKIYTFTRYLAWHALRRTGKTKKSFGNWSDEIVHAEIRDDEPEGTGDPGQTVPSAVTS